MWLRERETRVRVFLWEAVTLIKLWNKQFINNAALAFRPDAVRRVLALCVVWVSVWVLVFYFLLVSVAKSICVLCLLVLHWGEKPSAATWWVNGEECRNDEMICRWSKLISLIIDADLSFPQSFLKGELQIAADEAFINAVQSYYEIFLKNERLASMVTSGACSQHDLREVFKHNVEKRVRWASVNLREVMYTWHIISHGGILWRTGFVPQPAYLLGWLPCWFGSFVVDADCQN